VNDRIHFTPRAGICLLTEARLNLDSNFPTFYYVPEALSQRLKWSRRKDACS